MVQTLIFKICKSKQPLKENNKKEKKMDFGSYSQLPTLLPTASFWQRTKRKLRKLIIVSEKHPQLKEFLRSQAGLLKERRRHNTSYKSFTIHPLSLFRMNWDIFMFFCLLIHILLFFFCWSFFENLREDTKYGLLWIDWFCSICLYMETGLGFITGAVQYENKEIILENSKIIIKYLKDRFVIEVFGNIPFFVVKKIFLDEEIIEEYVCYIYVILTIFNLVQVIYLMRHFNVISAYLKWTLRRTRVAIIIINFLIFSHSSACFKTAFTNLIRQEKNRGNQGFYDYIRSLLVVLKLFFGAGQSKENYSGLIEMIISTILTAIGQIYVLYLLGIVILILISKETDENKYQEYFNQIKNFCDRKKLPKKLKHKILSYYECRFKNQFFNEEEIHNTISNNLVTNIKFHDCRKLIKNVTIFKNIPKSLKSAIVNCLKFEIFLPGDVIILEGLIGNSMFFLASGTAAIFSNEGKELTHISDGSYFGEISLLIRGQKRIATVTAIEKCEVYKLSYEDFQTVIKPHEYLLEAMETIALERMGLTRSSYQNMF